MFLKCLLGTSNSRNTQVNIQSKLHLQSFYFNQLTQVIYDIYYGYNTDSYSYTFKSRYVLRSTTTTWVLANLLMQNLFYYIMLISKISLEHQGFVIWNDFSLVRYSVSVNVFVWNILSILSLSMDIFEIRYMYFKEQTLILIICILHNI